MTRSSGSPARSKPVTSGWPASGMSTVAIFVLSLTAWLAVWVLAPMVIGWRPHVITSGSMEPHLRTGDVMLVAPVVPASIDGGEIVTYRDPLRSDRLVAHRVVRATDDGRLVTRGDANAAPDPVPVDPERVVGAGRVVVPLVGLPFVWATTGEHLKLAASGLAGLVVVAGALGLGRSTVAPSRRRTRSRRRVAVLAGFGTVAAAGAAGMAFSLRDPRALLATGILEMATVAAMAVPLIRERARMPALPARTARYRARRIGSATTVATAGAALVIVAASLVGGVAPTAGAFASATQNDTSSWDAATLQPPTNLAGSRRCDGLTKGAVDLTWTAAAHADSYRVLRSSSSGGPYSEIGTTTGTSFSNTGLPLSTTFHYVVESVRGPWTSGIGGEVSVTTPPSVLGTCVLS